MPRLSGKNKHFTCPWPFLHTQEGLFLFFSTNARPLRGRKEGIVRWFLQMRDLSEVGGRVFVFVSTNARPLRGRWGAFSSILGFSYAGSMFIIQCGMQKASLLKFK